MTVKDARDILGARVLVGEEPGSGGVLGLRL